MCSKEILWVQNSLSDRNVTAATPMLTQSLNKFKSRAKYVPLGKQDSNMCLLELSNIKV